jgi:hypothetical protein
MNDYRCDHGGMAMGRDCEKCKKLKVVTKLKAGDVHRGRDPKTNKLVYRTVIDTTFGNDVLYRNGRGTKRRSYQQRCTGEEWLAFIAGWKGNAQ